MKLLLHAPGPAGHGVVRHSAALSRLVAGHGVRPVGPADLPDLAHAQFTDALYGPDIATAAETFVGWAATAPRPLVVTLHDVPGADPDPARDARRGAGYRRVVAAADAVVVSAAHEAAKVRALTGRAATVIDLPVPEPVEGAAVPGWADRPTLGVLGFVYPGKGHDLAIDVAARHGLRVVAAGAAEDPALLRSLRGQAAGLGVDLHVTGPLSDADMTAAARAVTVPLVPGAAVSASGSLMTWLGCGRRPLVRTGPYAVELAARRPRSLHLCAVTSTGALDGAVRRALGDPGWTRSAHLDRPDTGGEHVALYRGLVPC